MDGTARDTELLAARLLCAAPYTNLAGIEYILAQPYRIVWREPEEWTKQRAVVTCSTRRA